MSIESVPTVLVTGGTGKVGRRLAARLTAAGHAVRAVSRGTPIPFDWYDPATWGPALDGVTAVYLIAPEESFPAEEFAAAAVAAGARRLVAQSGRNIHLLAEAAGVGPDAMGMHAAQVAVQNAGVEWTVLQPNSFNQNFSEGGYLEAVHAGELALPLEGVSEPFIDVEDLAAVAAAVLTEDGHHGRIYPLSGPESLPFAEAVAIVAKDSGRPFALRTLTPEEHDAVLRAAGAPEPIIGFIHAMYQVIRDGKLADVADGVPEVLGREPIAFADWAARAAEEGAWA